MADGIQKIWDFLKVRKKLWLSPFIIVLLMLIVLTLLSHGESVAPMIYKLF